MTNKPLKTIVQSPCSLVVVIYLKDLFLAKYLDFFLTVNYNETVRFQTTHSPLVFNNAIVFQTKSQKHFGVTFDLKLTLDEHLLNVFNKANKTISLLHKLQNVLPRITFIIYKAFVRTHLEHGDILYDQAFNNSFHKRLGSI